MTDDLANLYATKLINFKKADEFNKQAQDLYSSLIGSDLKTLPFSNYFNENRLTPDLFYSSPDALKKDKKNEKTTQNTFNKLSCLSSNPLVTQT